MFSTGDFVLKFEQYSDEELFEAYSEPDSYTDEAKKALNIVINNKGGLEKIMQRLEQAAQIVDEEVRISKETAKLFVEGTDTAFLNKIITSSILPADKVRAIIDNKVAGLKLEKEDKEIKPRTIFGSILGGSIASVIGGILWGLQMAWSGRIFVIFFIGLVLLCYGIIRLSTRQSQRNNAVAIATLISVILAVIIGQLVYEIVGKQ